MSERVAVIIVTYNSARVLRRCIEALIEQIRLPDAVIVVDNASEDTSYLEFLLELSLCRLIPLSRNEGFCGGNNLGYSAASGFDYILFLNPDAFLAPGFIRDALAAMADPKNSAVGVLSGTLLGFDLVAGGPTGKLDSTGIFQTWYGKWYDRGQGEQYSAIEIDSEKIETVPALCGALMFCRKQALEEATLRGREIFDDTFFMYKEDVDLSLRLKRRGWTMGFCAKLHCYHGRGWTNRNMMTPISKYLSARNELRVCLRNNAKGLLYSALKYFYVSFIELGMFSYAVKRRKLWNR
jgi:N-acetylglucosaminyl-diphospho-decaprenol L-rhamnosyltransferase